MAMNIEKLGFVRFASTHRFTVDQFAETQILGVSRTFLFSERGLVVVNGVQKRGRRSFGDLVVARISREREEAVLNDLSEGVRRATSVASLVSGSRPLADVPREAETRFSSPKDIVSSNSIEDDEKSGDSIVEGNLGDESTSLTAEVAPWMSDEEASAVVSEVILNGDDLSVIEYPVNEEAQRDANPINSLADSLLNKIDGDSRSFSLTEVGGVWKTGEDAGEVKIPEISISGFDVKDGVSPLAQWTSTELTMQHSQLARIATDVKYLQNAFAFFGAVRVVEALLNFYSTSPPEFGKLKELLNALDPFTISWLAHNLRQPILGIVTVDPLDLEKVITLKSNVWEEVHKFLNGNGKLWLHLQWQGL